MRTATQLLGSGLSITCSLLWLLLPAIASVQAVELNGVVAVNGKKMGFALLQGVPLSVQGQITTDAEWSFTQELLRFQTIPRPQGKDKLGPSLRGPEDIPSDLYAWRPGTNQPVRLMRLKGSEEVREVTQTRSSEWYLVELRGSPLIVVAINPRRGIVRTVDEAKGGSLLLSEKSSVHILVRDLSTEHGSKAAIFRFNESTGIFDQKLVTLPEGTHASGAEFLPGSDSILIPHSEQSKPRDYFLFDINTNTVSGRLAYDDLPAIEFEQQGTEFPDLEIHDLKKDGTEVTPRGIVLTTHWNYESGETMTYGEAEEEVLFIRILGASNGDLSPSQKFVSMFSQGVLIVREIAWITGDNEEDFRQEVEKNRMIKQAKQLGIGLILYASDNDDFMPLKKDWEEAVAPYLKDRTIVENASVLMFEKLLSTVEDPFGTPMATVDGKYGYVLIYVDSSVKWFPKARPKAKPEDSK